MEVVNGVKDDRIKYYKKANEERAVARNFGINVATGDYITFLDSDDILYSNHLEEALKLIKSHDRPEWFHLAYEVKDEKGNILRKENKRKGDINKSLITGNHLSCMGVFIRKDIIVQHKFNEDRDIIGSEDYELWLRLAAKYPLHYSNNITGSIIQHAGRSVTSSFDADKLINRMEMIIEVVRDSKIFTSREFKKFVGHRFLYCSLHLALLKHKKESVHYFWKAVKAHYPVLFTKKMMAILKNLP